MFDRCTIAKEIAEDIERQKCSTGDKECEIATEIRNTIISRECFDWGRFVKNLEVKHYAGYRTEMAYGLGGRDLRSVVKFEIEELENTDIIDWTGVPDYITMIDALYAHGYTEAVWLCKEKQHVIDYYCDGDLSCPIEKYEITDGVILSDLGDDGQLIAYQPKKIKVEEL